MKQQVWLTVAVMLASEYLVAQKFEGGSFDGSASVVSGVITLAGSPTSYTQQVTLTRTLAISVAVSTASVQSYLIPSRSMEQLLCLCIPIRVFLAAVSTARQQFVATASSRLM